MTHLNGRDIKELLITTRKPIVLNRLLENDKLKSLTVSCISNCKYEYGMEGNFPVYLKVAKYKYALHECVKQLFMFSVSDAECS
jgi:hypothetical protein